MSVDPDRWAWAEIDLDAIGHNVGAIADAVRPAAVWAVVKADGYGHGASAVARRALESGAAGLCVALAGEGLALRSAGVTAPILVLSQQPPAALRATIDAGLIATAYTAEYLDALATAGAGSTCTVHLKIDTGMHRVGADPSDAVALAAHAARLAPAIAVEGVFTHLACADDPAAGATAQQLASFERVLDELDVAGLRPPVSHAANSAAALAVPGARFDFVRAGIAIYGISPGPGVDELARGLRPALSLRARVGHVRSVAAGEHVSYGWRHRFEAETIVATVPLGYADGVPRRMGTLPDRPGADVLIGGTRCPIVGVVTMDQLMVDVGGVPGGVAIGDEVVLIGRQGDSVVAATDWAERLGTIGYEIVCGISARIPRRVHGEPAASGSRTSPHAPGPLGNLS